ncbi:hypothetical protein PAAG_02038 [Paracoccidioides lutzii Pb01]|uniref:Uncharacterized protein n=1 Tax=Paracoccidioides lutzii (strain ATCC MYA-826 / Pb01) TaxID=502779 RepID=C1GU43_PARBA|nr:hypothetical protein PAAG_02038 [Paracoccidioides lutzii Pb01]EEH39849.2 hypothetical protein PAAG_02038 [Paracoccidioides lutzii Pb01]
MPSMTIDVRTTPKPTMDQSIAVKREKASQTMANLYLRVDAGRKVKHELATMNYLRRNTSIPVPEALGSGIC